MAKEETKTREQELQDQIAELREEIRKISSTLTSIGSEKLNKVKGKAEAFFENTKNQGEEAFENAREKLYEAEKNVARCVREKPVESLAVAAIAGALIALLLRR